MTLCIMSSMTSSCHMGDCIMNDVIIIQSIRRDHTTSTLWARPSEPCCLALLVACQTHLLVHPSMRGMARLSRNPVRLLHGRGRTF